MIIMSLQQLHDENLKLQEALEDLKAKYLMLGEMDEYLTRLAIRQQEIIDRLLQEKEVKD